MLVCGVLVHGEFHWWVDIVWWCFIIIIISTALS